MVESCCAPLCKNKRNSDIQKSFFKFPLADPHLTKQWVAALNKENWQPSKYSTVCKDHFPRAVLYHKRNNLYSLKKGAVPVLSKLSTGLSKRKYVRKKPYAARRNKLLGEDSEDIFLFDKLQSDTSKFNEDVDEDGVTGLDDSVYVKDQPPKVVEIAPLFDGSDLILFPDEFFIDAKPAFKITSSEEIENEVAPDMSAELNHKSEIVQNDFENITNAAEYLVTSATELKEIISPLKVFECIQCKVSYDSVLKLQVHVNIFHSTFSKSHFCFLPNCTDVFQSKRELKLHISSKHGDWKHLASSNFNDQSDEEYAADRPTSNS